MILFCLIRPPTTAIFAFRLYDTMKDQRRLVLATNLSNARLAQKGLPRVIRFESGGKLRSIMFQVYTPVRRLTTTGAPHYGLLTEGSSSAALLSFSRRRSSTNKRSSKLVVRVVRRWVTGNRRCAIMDVVLSRPALRPYSRLLAIMVLPRGGCLADTSRLEVLLHCAQREVAEAKARAGLVARVMAAELNKRKVDKTVGTIPFFCRIWRMPIMRQASTRPGKVAAS
jgi:hypothetical protein